MPGSLCRVGHSHPRPSRNTADFQAFVLHPPANIPPLLGRKRSLNAAGVIPLDARLKPLIAVPLHASDDLV